MGGGGHKRRVFTDAAPLLLGSADMYRQDVVLCCSVALNPKP